MTASRRDTLPRLPVVFGLAEYEAAAAVGLGTTKFREMVDDGRMPKPRLMGGRMVYDVDELRAAFKSFPHQDEERVEADTWADA